ncbi:MAG: hypothetical protein A2722_01730 [Candidatus Doudnabacteria bacterium RIFCSPHIGHO2_01_FULL_50_11]|uniref:Uncharacterized protein n=1 Tax=Candidatus Doudnabacteria bacterium RIFCSPHIGHO2_01_FULL_50_11 TaxID=1817828 RepID=A0A1F5PES8_9BACT|nr:MAG: hypothetical protein A2722_01730 [Candidatus Doudnabacteria bacterium RIFCSPHIGHO2_01_FULL_50_11]HLC44445.1 hypothetical protein [Patescibacteria group bacterium]
MPSKAVQPEVSLRDNTRKFLHGWMTLPREQKKLILPRLLDSMVEWKRWLFSEYGILVWLRRVFSQANIPFLH